MDIDAALVEIGHALNMLAELPSHAEDSGLPPVVRAACLESYFINLRLTFEFIGVKRDRNQISRHDFLQDWKPASGEKLKILALQYGFASEQVAHLSKKRTFPQGSPITPHPIKMFTLTVLVFDLMREFADALTAEDSPYAERFNSIVRDSESRFKLPDKAYKPTDEGLLDNHGIWVSHFRSVTIVPSLHDCLDHVRRVKAKPLRGRYASLDKSAAA
jgi:hypothetical protein